MVAAVIAFAFLTAGIIGYFFVWRPYQRAGIPANYRTIFEYYNMGYADQQDGSPRRDWDALLETKSGMERTKFAREIKAYESGYIDAESGNPKLTDRITETNEENNALWREWNKRLD